MTDAGAIQDLAAGVGEPTVDELDPEWRLKSWESIPVGKGEPTVDESDPS